MEDKLSKLVKIACLVMMVAASIWFSFGIRGGKAYFKVGTWQHPILVSEASNDDTGGEHDSSGSEFA